MPRTRTLSGCRNGPTGRPPARTRVPGPSAKSLTPKATQSTAVVGGGAGGLVGAAEVRRRATNVGEVSVAPSRTASPGLNWPAMYAGGSFLSALGGGLFGSTPSPYGPTSAL